MKTKLLKSFLLALIAAMLPQLASAYDFMVDGLCYNYNSDGTSVTVTWQRTNSYGYGNGYENLTGELNIPENLTYNGTSYFVTSIDDFAFDSCTGLTSVTIPNSVTTIGNGAFYGCSGLTSVTIPNSVTEIGGTAFHYCTGLTSITWNPKICEINSQFDRTVFCGCSNINTFTFGDEVEIIPAYLCGLLIGLQSVTIPNSVTTIGDFAFSGCIGLTSVTIPNSVTSIGEYNQEIKGKTNVEIIPVSA